MIKQSSSSFAIQEEGNYGVLFNISHMQKFVDEVKQVETMTHAFCHGFQSPISTVVKHLPTNIKTTMLYEDYLRNFQIGV